MIGQVAANIRQKNTAASDRLAAVDVRLFVRYVYLMAIWVSLIPVLV